jgi:hypothetical protein
VLKSEFSFGNIKENLRERTVCSKKNLYGSRLSVSIEKGKYRTVFLSGTVGITFFF